MTTRDDLTQRFDDDPAFQSLARIITEADPWAEKQLEAADAVIAAGWRPPSRTVSTVEELRALNDAAIVIDGDNLAWQLFVGRGDGGQTVREWLYVEDGWTDANGKGISGHGDEYMVTAEHLQPLTLIHEGREPRA